MQKKIIENTVRGQEMKFVGYTRALELCARMNYETEVLEFIDRMPPKSLLFDLGACEERFAMYAAMRGVEVYAFEPEQLNYQAMLENMDLNSHALAGKLKPLKLAVGERNHEAKLKIAQPWAGGHQRIVSTAPSRTDLNFNFTSEQTIEVVSLDEYILQNSLPVPDYLKVDVDGSELPFIKGARKTLADTKLKSLMFELCKEDPDYEPILQMLRGVNFHKSEETLVVPGLYNIVFLRHAQP